MEEDSLMDEDQPTPEQLNRARRAQVWQRKAARYYQRKVIVPKKRRRGAGAPSREAAGAPSSEDTAAAARRAQATAVRRAVAELKFIPDEPCPDDAEFLVPPREAVPRRGELLPAFKDPSGDEWTPSFDKIQPDSDSLLSAFHEPVPAGNKSLDPVVVVSDFADVAPEFVDEDVIALHKVMSFHLGKRQWEH